MIDANYREKTYLDCILVNWNTLDSSGVFLWG